MLINTLASHRGHFSREGEEGGGGGTGEQEQQQQTEFKPPASQEELDRIITSRLQRERARYSDYEVLQEKANLWDQLSVESQTDAERREAELRAEAFHEAMSTAVPIAVRARFEREALGVLTDDQLDSLLEDLDLVKYANDDGTPDKEKIAKKVAALAPKNGGGGRNGSTPGFGQGSGFQQSTRKKGEAGIEAARRRWPELANKES